VVERKIEATDCVDSSRRNLLLGSASLAVAGLAAAAGPALAQQAATSASAKPNILVIMADDIGWFNLSINHRGIMGYKTPIQLHPDARMDPPEGVFRGQDGQGHIPRWHGRT
jgi:hypothetical protein